MKKFLLPLFSLLCLSATAQFKITSSNAPVVNDVNISATDTIPNEGLSAGDPGMNQTYFVSDVDLDVESSVFFEDPNSFQSGSEYPETDVAFAIDDIITAFAETRNDRVEITASEIVNPADGSVSSNRWQNPLSVLRYPYGFGDSYKDTGRFVASFFIGQDFGGIQIDSGRVDLTIEVDAMVDGAGTFEGINGVFSDVIRERQVVTSTTIFEICVVILPGLPCRYQDASEFTGGTNEPVTEVEYRFYGAQNKFEYATLIYNENEDTLREVSINIADFAPNSISEVKKLGNKVYPNPAHDVINVKAEQNASVQVMDISGRVLLSRKGAGSINIATLSKGTYVISIQEDDAVYSGQLIKQ